VVNIFKGGEINEKDCVDDLIVGFDYGVGRVPLVASWRWPWWRPLREGKMRQLLVFSSLFVLLVCQQVVFSGELELTPGEKRRIESGAIDTFETIISLCKRERFDEIYEYGDSISQKMMSKEMFISERRGCGLASSWETVRDIEVKIISPKRVSLKAVLGFKGSHPYSDVVSGDTQFSTRIFEMTLEKDGWRINLSHLPYGIEVRQ